MTNAHKRRLAITSVLVLFAATAAAQAPAAAPAPAPASVEVVRVSSKSVDRQVKLPGEFQPYLAVPIYAKLAGFVKRVAVDRGSTVKQGQVLVTLEAPEMQAQVTEAQSKAQALELQRAEAEAKLAAAQSTYDRLKAASATPGVVAENDVVVAQKTAEAAQALVRSYEDSIKAAQAQVQSVKDLAQYLTLKAPFDGVITERNVHPGALVGPGRAPTHGGGGGGKVAPPSGARPDSRGVHVPVAVPGTDLVISSIIEQRKNLTRSPGEYFIAEIRQRSWFRIHLYHVSSGFARNQLSAKVVRM